MKWYVNENDVFGGWAISNLDLPLSQHDHREDGDPKLRSYVIADMFMTEEDARVIAHLLTTINYVPLPLGLGSDAHGAAGWWGNAEVQINEGLPS